MGKNFCSNLYLTILVFFGTVLPCVAGAQTYPSRSIRIINGFPPGGATDILARLIGGCVAHDLGVQVIVENKPGAGANRAIKDVVTAAPDGYTLLFTSPSAAINASLYKNLDYNFLRDIVPISGVMSAPNVLVVNASFPAKTLAEFVVYAKRHPGKLNMATSSNGTSSHLSAMLFKMMAGLDMVHVPYKGEAPALVDLLAGQVDLVFGTTAAGIGHIQAGRLRALAVTSAVRSPILPDVPALQEVVSGYEASNWWGIGAPKKTPAEIVERLNVSTNACLKEPHIRGQFSDMGGTPLLGSPEVFGKLVADETAKWAKVVEFSGAKAE